MHVLEFSIELQNAEVSVFLLKSNSTTDALHPTLKVLKTSKGNTCGRVSFWNRYGWVDWTAQIF